MKTRAFNLIILDESGSMSCIERQALNGLNETLQTIRKVQEKHPEQDQYVSIVPFETGNIRLLRNKVSIKEIEDLKNEEYNPGGCTPLFDAIGFGINSIKKDVAETDTVLVTIITDGEENSSKEYSGKVIAGMIDELKHKGWMFTYIGANQDAIRVAKSMNIGNALNFDQDEAGTAEMFRRDRKSRERFLKMSCCIANYESASSIFDAKRKLACEENYFDDDKND
ncbi:MAG: VWA domain-containing protein [Paludibacteraceae bacterium]|nr:VWA domain-containing protein [Paludibacteraceae bacterium]